MKDNQGCGRNTILSKKVVVPLFIISAMLTLAAA
jgi:hypothetical protein